MSCQDKGYIESAVDKTKELATDAKDAVGNAYDKMVGNTAEDKAAKNVKDAADTCAKKATDARDYTSDKMRDAARTIEGK